MSDQSGSADDFGGFLREARERRGVSLQELSVATKISMTVLQALERNDMSQVPGGIFSRSFVRTYAEEVGLDPETTVNSFLDAYPEKGGRDPARGGGERHISRRHSDSPIPGGALWVIVVGVSVVVLALFFWTRGGERLETEPSTETSPIVERVPIEPPPRSRPSPRTVTAPSDGQPAGADDEATASDAMTIEIALSGESWVSMTVDGERVLSRILQAGDSEVYEAREGVLLNVGDAGVFEFSINQQAGLALGESGENVTVEIDRENYRRFVTP